MKTELDVSPVKFQLEVGDFLLGAILVGSVFGVEVDHGGVVVARVELHVVVVPVHEGDEGVVLAVVRGRWDPPRGADGWGGACWSLSRLLEVVAVAALLRAVLVVEVVDPGSGRACSPPRRAAVSQRGWSSGVNHQRSNCMQTMYDKCERKAVGFG